MCFEGPISHHLEPTKNPHILLQISHHQLCHRHFRLYIVSTPSSTLPDIPSWSSHASSMYIMILYFSSSSTSKSCFMFELELLLSGSSSDRWAKSRNGSGENFVKKYDKSWKVIVVYWHKNFNFSEFICVRYIS